MKSFALLLLALLPSYASEALSSPKSAGERDQVLQVVQGFFDAMAKSDGEALRALAVPGSQVTVAPRPGTEGPVRRRMIEADVDSLKANKNQLLERMWNPTVLIEGRIAVVWTPYDIHRNGKFAHNGIDVFTLMKLTEGWKIVSIAYTIEPEPPSRHPAGPR